MKRLTYFFYFRRGFVNRFMVSYYDKYPYSEYRIHVLDTHTSDSNKRKWTKYDLSLVDYNL